ncbi:MAG: outer membrane beta-barrel domain-containing protein [bacterium]|nr:outer membrane beta-barrel domain-containing protein [Gammaproteobacteria bacterium]HIL96666.1 outer membrane beta-barrel domain-containing protein [Pseudomonadales bacterium]
METRPKRVFLALSRSLRTTLFLTIACAGIASTVYADNDTQYDDPLGDSVDLDLISDIERQPVQISDIDTENFEIGISGGLLSIEDFETNPVVVGSLTYHVTEDFFVEARFGTSKIGTTSFEKLSGGASLLSDDDRDIRFYDLSLGLNLFPGETFIFNRWAVNSGFYFVGGVGSTEFAGDQKFTASGGVGYRIIANDFLAMNLQVRDHIFETEITGESKTTHNFEVVAGISIFF